MKILLIEDIESLRAMYRELLESLGHVVVEACGGNDGLAKFRADKFDAVLSDIEWPTDLGKNNGLDLARIVRSFDPEILIILMSGESGLLYSPLALELTRGHVLGKPFGADELNKMLGGIQTPTTT